MNEKEILTIILKNTYTKPDLLRRFSLLRQYLQDKFFGGIPDSLMDFLKKKSATLYDCTVMEDWQKTLMPYFNAKNLAPMLKSISEDIEKLNIITIYIPVELNAYELEKMGRWLRKNRGSLVLLEVYIDETKVAGCAIAEDSQLRDYSLPYFLTKHRDKIFDILKQYEPKPT